MCSKAIFFEGLRRAPSTPTEILRCYLAQYSRWKRGRRKFVGREEIPSLTSDNHDISALHAPDVAIVVPNFNGARYLDKLFRSIRSLNYPRARLRVFFVDNGSRDASVELASKASEDIGIEFHLIVNKSNLGFAASCNQVLQKRCRPLPDYFLVANNDVEISRNCVIHLVAKMLSDNRIGICDGRQLPIPHPKPFDHLSGNTYWCSAAVCLISGQALAVTGGFDELFFMYCEDVDLSWRMRLQGFRCVHVPDATFFHPVSKDKEAESFRVFYRMRNGCFMRWIYGSPFDVLFYKAVIVMQVLMRRVKLSLVARVLMEEIAHFPHLIRRRLRFRPVRKRCPVVGFYGTDYHAVN